MFAGNEAQMNNTVTFTSRSTKLEIEFQFVQTECAWNDSNKAIYPDTNSIFT